MNQSFFKFLKCLNQLSLGSGFRSRAWILSWIFLCLLLLSSGALHSTSRAQQNAPTMIRKFYDGEEDELSEIDALIAFTISQGITDPQTITDYITTVFPDVSVTEEDITGSSFDPLALSDFDGDDFSGTVQDAAVFYAMSQNITIAEDIETYCVETLELPNGCPLDAEAVIPPVFPTSEPPPTHCAPDPSFKTTPPMETVVFGDGSAASCTASALRDLLSQVESGAVIGVHCPDHHVIEIDQTIATNKAFTLDGSPTLGLILDGMNQHRIFQLLREQTGDQTDRTLVSLRSMTLRRGLATLAVDNFDIGKGSGGAIQTGLGLELQVEDIVFEDNRAEGSGGAVWIDFQNVPTFRSCQFTNNRAEELGGAINTNSSGATQAGTSNPRDGQFEILGCNFTNNVAAQGGALRTVFYSVTIRNSTFLNNSTEVLPIGNKQNIGGALVIEGTRSGIEGKLPGESITITDSLFDRNVGHHSGGSVVLWPYDQDIVNVEGSVFTNNRVVRASPNNQVAAGGGFYLQQGFAGGQSTAFLSDLVIANNHAEGHGGGLWADDADNPNHTLALNVTNTIIYGNVSGLDPDTRSGAGGITLSIDGEVRFDNVTIAENVSYSFDGGGVYLNGTEPSQVMLKNSSFENNCARLKVDGSFENGNDCEFKFHANLGNDPNDQFNDEGGNREWPDIDTTIPGWKQNLHRPLTDSIRIEEIGFVYQAPNPSDFCF